MPTPSPIIVARVGAIVGTVTAWPRRPIADKPTSRPKTAETIGRPIATSDPKVNARMIIAAIRPTRSLDSVAGSDSSLPIGPPTATSIPAASAGWAAPRTSCARSSVSSSPPTFSSTGMKAVRLSLLICAAPCWLNGSVAFATCGTATIALWESSIACLFFESVT